MIIELKVDLSKIDHTKESFIEAINTDKTKEEAISMGKKDAKFVKKFLDKIDFESEEIEMPKRSEIAEDMLKELSIEQILFFAAHCVAQHLEQVVTMSHMKKLMGQLEQGSDTPEIEEVSEESTDDPSIGELAKAISSSVSEEK